MSNTTLLKLYSDLDSVAAKLEWLSKSGLLLQVTFCSSEVFYQTFIHTSLETHPLLGRIATIAFTVPVTSVYCEGGISTYNDIKTTRVNRLSRVNIPAALDWVVLSKLFFL